MDFHWTAFLVVVAIVLLFIAFRLVRKEREADDFSTPLPMTNDTGELLCLATGTTSRPFFTRGDNREKDETGVSAIVAWNLARARLYRLRAALPPGYVAFLSNAEYKSNFSDYDSAELIIAPGNDQFDILRLAQTASANHNVDNRAVAAKLKTWDGRFGIDIYYAQTDAVEIAFQSLPSDVSELAKEISDFSPDTLDQGIGSVEALAAAIAKRRGVHLSWA